MKEIRFKLEEPAESAAGAKTKNKRETGSDYEEKAAGYLRSCGYTILEKNYRIRTGEIDLVFRDRENIVFCEVKYRTAKQVNAALEAVDQRKQMLSRTADLLEMIPGRFGNVRIIQSDIIQTDDRIHRRSDLMGHVGKESCLGLAGIFRCS